MDNQTLFSEFKTHLQNLLTQLPKTEKTYFELLKISSREVPVGNLLAFFFNPNEKHGLGNLFIESLFETVCHKLDTPGFIGPLKQNGFIATKTELRDGALFDFPVISVTDVIPEDKTKKTNDAKRIDILINAKEFVIVIEFKINHILNNRLDIYKKHILKKYCGHADKPVFFVVLTPGWKQHQDKNEEHNCFRQITLTEFVGQIDKTLTPALREEISTNYYRPLLMDFIETIKNRTARNRELRSKMFKNEELQSAYNTIIEKNLLGKFTAGEKDEKVAKLALKIERIEREISSKINSLEKELKVLAVVCNQKRIERFDGFLQITLGDRPGYSIKVRLTLEDWRLELWQKAEGKDVCKIANHLASYDTGSHVIAVKVQEAINSGFADGNTAEETNALSIAAV